MAYCKTLVIFACQLLDFMKKTMQIDGCNLILLIEIAQTDYAETNFSYDIITLNLMASIYKIFTLLIIMLIHFVKPLKPTVAIWVHL